LAVSGGTRTIDNSTLRSAGGIRTVGSDTRMVGSDTSMINGWTLMSVDDTRMVDDSTLMGNGGTLISDSQHKLNSIISSMT
jgi:hypothetical protein